MFNVDKATKERLWDLSVDLLSQKDDGPGQQKMIDICAEMLETIGLHNDAKELRDVRDDLPRAEAFLIALTQKHNAYMSVTDPAVEDRLRQIALDLVFDNTSDKASIQKKIKMAAEALELLGFAEEAKKVLEARFDLDRAADIIRQLANQQS